MGRKVMGSVRTLSLKGFGKVDLVYVPPCEVPFLSVSDATRNALGSNTGVPPVGRRIWSLSQGFFIGCHVVSRALYKRVMNDAPWNERPGTQYPLCDDAPANYVSHEDAVLFCERLSHEVGINVRLPTELEQEAVASGGTMGDFYWTKEPWNVKAEKSGKQHALFNAFDLWKRVEPMQATIGTKKPNQYGVYDSIGLIREWVADEYNYGSGVNVAETEGLPLRARDVQFRGGPIRVAKGGTYRGDLSCVARWVRMPRMATNRGEDVGFRICIQDTQA